MDFFLDIGCLYLSHKRQFNLRVTVTVGLLYTCKILNHFGGLTTILIIVQRVITTIAFSEVSQKTPSWYVFIFCSLTVSYLLGLPRPKSLHKRPAH